MSPSLQPLLLTLALAVGATLTGCVSNADQEKKLGVPPVTMVPLPAVAPVTPPPTIVVDAVPTALPTNTPPPATTDAFYRVLPGDTGFKISRKHHLALHDLQALNPDVQWNRLKVGQLVRIRADH